MTEYWPHHQSFIDCKYCFLRQLIYIVNLYFSDTFLCLFCSFHFVRPFVYYYTLCLCHLYSTSILSLFRRFSGLRLCRVKISNYTLVYAVSYFCLCFPTRVCVHITISVKSWRWIFRVSSLSLEANTRDSLSHENMYTEVLCHCRCGTINILSISRAMGADHMASCSATIHRQW